MRKIFEKYPLSALLFLAFVLRVINLNFPYFSPDEAEIAAQIKDWIPLMGSGGVRIIFAALGTFLVYLCYRFAKMFLENEKLAFFTALVVAISPPLIYLSKLPNIIIFYLVLVLMVINLVSQYLGSKRYLVLLIFLSLACLIFFLTKVLNPPLFSDSGLLTNINIYRGQGLQSGWPNIAEKILFNKSYFLEVGLLNWLSSINPAVLFGQFDEKGVYGITSMGAFPKILIIPFFFGIVYLIKKKTKELILLLSAVLLLSFPSIFSYPNFSYLFVILSLPFFALIISFGLLRFNLGLAKLVLVFAVFETVVNLAIMRPEINKTNTTRPGWIIPIVKELSDYKGEKKIVISDDIASQIESYIRWYGGKNLTEMTLVVGSKHQFFRCTESESFYVIMGKRDLAYVNKYINNVKVVKTYEDFIGNKIAYKLEERICVK